MTCRKPLIKKFFTEDKPLKINNGWSFVINSVLLQKIETIILPQELATKVLVFPNRIPMASEKSKLLPFRSKNEEYEDNNQIKEL